MCSIKTLLSHVMLWEMKMWKYSNWQRNVMLPRIKIGFLIFNPDL
jgi:hypothetical protein